MAGFDPFGGVNALGNLRASLSGSAPAPVNAPFDFTAGIPDPTQQASPLASTGGGPGVAPTVAGPSGSTAGVGLPTGNWAQDILNMLHDPASQQNLQALQAWHQAEGGNASYNPFNTTQGAPGASNYNSVGVKNYGSEDQGVQATVQTLQNGRYGNILQALASGNNARAVAQAIANSPWGTGALVLKVLGG